MSNDTNYIDLEEAERREALNLANQLVELTEDWPEPMPLIRPMGIPQPFPTDALGSVLGNAALGIADIVQCPVAIAGSSVLAVASLAVQPHVDVVHPATGRRVPVSLFLLTIAESGERKSAADSEALAPVYQHEKSMAEAYKSLYGRWRNSHEAWEAARATLKRKTKGDWQALERELSALGDEPKPPPKPHILVTEPTYEGLAKLLAESQPSVGLFSAEGGGFLGGHAMREDSRLRALTGLSELWDGSPLKRTRAGEGAFHLAGRRLTFHLMVQPNVAPLLLGDEMAMGQGFLSCLLVSYPQTTQGQRFRRDPLPGSRHAIDHYVTVMRAVLAREPRQVGDSELDPLPLALTSQALARWRGFADEMERELSEEGLSSGIRGLRNKVTEMALRIAGILAGLDAFQEITVELLERGISLATYFLSEARRLYAASMTSAEIARAGKLLRWLVDRKASEISLRDIQTLGPNMLREAAKVRATVNTLVQHHLGRLETRGSTKKSEVLVLSPLARTVL